MMIIISQLTKTIDWNVASIIYNENRALKKAERIKRLKILFEKIKKQIKEKYMLCNLYVKNLPDNFDEPQLNELFAKYGPIRSCKLVKKELVQSYLGIKRSVKLFGYVCFFEKEHAHEALAALNNAQVFQNAGKLFVDYHKSKQDRTEFLKLKMLAYQKKNQMMPDIPFPQNMGKGSKIIIYSSVPHVWSAYA